MPMGSWHGHVWEAHQLACAKTVAMSAEGSTFVYRHSFERYTVCSMPALGTTLAHGLQTHQPYHGINSETGHIAA